jgi:hypothetical protein
MIIRNPPESWFWSHDLEPRFFNNVVTSGMRAQRLSNYGKGERRRFAAIVFRDRDQSGITSSIAMPRQWRHSYRICG